MGMSRNELLGLRPIEGFIETIRDIKSKQYPTYFKVKSPDRPKSSGMLYEDEAQSFDQATFDLALAFYSQYLDRSSEAKASLRKAQQAFIDKKKRS